MAGKDISRPSISSIKNAKNAKDNGYIRKYGGVKRIDQENTQEKKGRKALIKVQMANKTYDVAENNKNP